MFRKVTDAFWTSPQITPADVAEAAREGAKVIVNNRPDGEEPGQPSGDSIRAAAEALGLAYVAAPVRGGPGPAEIAAMRAALDGAGGPVLAYCRSGTRSILTWAAAQVGAGVLTPEQARALALNAGYDLSRWI